MYESPESSLYNYIQPYIYNNLSFNFHLNMHTQVCSLAWQTGRSFGKYGGIPSIGFWLRKLTGFNLKPTLSDGMIGKSSWHGIWWRPTTYQTTISLFSIALSLQKLEQHFCKFYKVWINIVLDGWNWSCNIMNIPLDTFF